MYTHTFQGLFQRTISCRIGCVKMLTKVNTKKGEFGGPKSPVFYGAPGMIRTCDLLIRSQALYPTELRAHRENAY